jgi:hypothetical protein
MGGERAIIYFGVKCLTICEKYFEKRILCHKVPNSFGKKSPKKGKTPKTNDKNRILNITKFG